MDLSNQKQLEDALKTGLTSQYGTGLNGFRAFMKSASKYGFGAALGGALAVGTSANAAESGLGIDSIVTQFVTDGSDAIKAIGIGLITLAGIAIVFKWVKAAFFS